MKENYFTSHYYYIIYEVYIFTGILVFSLFYIFAKTHETKTYHTYNTIMSYLINFKILFFYKIRLVYISYFFPFKEKERMMKMKKRHMTSKIYNIHYFVNKRFSLFCCIIRSQEVWMDFYLFLISFSYINTNTLRTYTLYVLSAHI